MPHRKIPILMATLVFATLTATASDFWLAKDWHQWTKDECTRILVDSPWAHIWKVPTAAENTSHTPAQTDRYTLYGPVPKPASEATQSGPSEAGYQVQLRSAFLIREAKVRQMQFDRHYDKMTDVQRTQFDIEASRILDANYENEIRIHLYFSNEDPGVRRERTDIPDFVRPGAEYLHASLVTGDGARIKPTRVDLSAVHPSSVDVCFPRITNGAPTIKAGQKHFAFQFEVPEYVDAKGVFGPPRHISVNFDLSKMVIGGVLIY